MVTGLIVMWRFQCPPYGFRIKYESLYLFRMTGRRTFEN